MKKIFSLILTITMTLTANAQSVTYNHDATKMNQFLMQETGTGHFVGTSEWYYDIAHRSYKNSLLVTNKSLTSLGNTPLRGAIFFILTTFKQQRNEHETINPLYSCCNDWFHDLMLRR